MTNQLITKIEISDIPGFFPDEFIDTYQSKFRVIAVNSIIETNTIDWGVRQKEKVFDRKYNAYKITVFVNETQRQELNNIIYANDVKITLENGDIHQAKDIKFGQPRTIKGTYYSTVVIEYIDENSRENIQHADVKDSDTEYTTLTLYNNSVLTGSPLVIDSNWSNIINEDNKFIVKTKFEPLLSYEVLNEVTDEQTGKQKKSTTNTARTVKFKGFFNEETVNNLAFYLPLVTNVEIFDGTNTYTLDNEKILPDNIIVEIVGTNYYSIDILLKFDILNYKHYN